MPLSPFPALPVGSSWFTCHPGGCGLCRLHPRIVEPNTGSGKEHVRINPVEEMRSCLNGKCFSALLGANSSFYRAGPANSHGARPLGMIRGGGGLRCRNQGIFLPLGKSGWYHYRPPYSPKGSSSLWTPEDWNARLFSGDHFAQLHNSTHLRSREIK